MKPKLAQFSVICEPIICWDRKNRDQDNNEREMHCSQGRKDRQEEERHRQGKWVLGTVCGHRQTERQVRIKEMTAGAEKG